MAKHRLYRRYKGKTYPTVEAVVHLHDEVLTVSGGTAGIRDLGSLKAALDKPFTTVGGKDAYPTFFYQDRCHRLLHRQASPVRRRE